MVSKYCCCPFSEKTIQEGRKIQENVMLHLLICNYSLGQKGLKVVFIHNSLYFFSIRYISGLWNSLKAVLSLPQLYYLGIGIMLPWPGVVCLAAVCFRGWELRGLQELWC